MTRYVVAVSGGVDSVALLHMLHGLGEHDLTVAHVDHGIRDDSDEDERFVRALAQRYDLPFTSTRVALGADASEATARAARYAFLHQVATERSAALVTAHHADDVVESVAINLHRGTGWRGVATHSAPITRPLLGFTKAQLYHYAVQHGLEWREDSTNRDERYLRNRIRRHVATMDVAKKRHILALREQQRRLRQAIRAEVKGLVGDGPLYSRYFFTHIPDRVALECLRSLTKGALTRPQLERALLAIKTAPAESIFEAGAGRHLLFTTRNFSLSLVK